MREYLTMLLVPQCKNPGPETTRREVEWAWFAGIMDGEGNFNVQVRPAQNGKQYVQTKIRVANTDVRMIQKISELFVSENIVFFYGIKTPNGVRPQKKTYLNIEVSSQGSSEKVLRKIIPYLVNKRQLAEIMLDLIVFVRKMPKGGNTKAIDYVNDPEFIRLKTSFDEQMRWYLDPSTTTRRAREVISW